MCPGASGRQGHLHDFPPDPRQRVDRVIAAQGLTKTYGQKTAVDGITFSVEPGRVTGFLGPNGAGKSTTMRMILGLDRPSAGSVTVNGRRYADFPAPLREVGALLEARALHPGRSARDHLRWLAVSNAIPTGRVDEVLALVGLEAVAGQRVGKFSLGMGQRLGIAVALLGDPPVVVLDEPVNGLDPEGIRWVRTLARQLAAEGRTVFVSSHLMSEMALTADHLVVIGRGKVLADCSMSEFIADHAASYVRVQSPQRGAVADLLRRQGLDVAVHDEELRVQGLGAAAIGELVGKSGLFLHELTLVRSSLEDAFMTLTADSVEYSAHDMSTTAAGIAR
jgi:ABC-2 type transport system ATP-binding protein